MTLRQVDFRLVFIASHSSTMAIFRSQVDGLCKAMDDLSKALPHRVSEDQSPTPVKFLMRKLKKVYGFLLD